MNHQNKIAIVGLGYVGLPLAVEFGKQFDTLGFDINAERIAQLRNGQDRTLETTSEELAQAVRLQFSTDAAALAQCNVFIVTVPTPIDKANRPDLTPLVKASETVSKVLKQGDIVIYESTVYPGATEEVCVPVLEKFSKLKFNQGFFCGYSPERINPGDKINTLTKIKKITSGSTPEIADKVDSLYKSIITAGTYRAKRMIELSGLAVKDEENPDGDIEIAITGLRPGEKLFEELLIGDNPMPTAHPRIMKAHEEFIPWDQLKDKLKSLDIALNINDVAVVRQFLTSLVKGYTPNDEIVDWIYLEQITEANKQDRLAAEAE